MMHETDFRVMRVEVSDEDGLSVDVDLATEVELGTCVTLLTGRNGTGKSRLLSAIAASFETLDGRSQRRKDSIVIGYRTAGTEFEYRVKNGKVSAYIDGHPANPAALPRPRSIAAATASAFDKFPLPKEQDLFGVKRPREGVGRYKYLGLRDARGRISSRAGVIRALEQIFDANSDDSTRRHRVSEVFRYLGYAPTVDVSYTWSAQARKLAQKDGKVSASDIKLLLGERRGSRGAASRPSIPRYMFEDESIAKDLARAIEALRGLGERRSVHLVANFAETDPGDEGQLRMARQLTRAGMLKMSEVVLTQEVTHRRVEISEASSGELSLVVTLLGIASSIENQSLILIDEPEISLHPEWQAEYLELLSEVFSEYHGCHFIIATHSPILVSGAETERTSIVDLEHPRDDGKHFSATTSVDEVLLTTFGLVSKENLYFRDLLVRALRGAEDGDLADLKYDETMSALQVARQELPDGDSAGQLIDQLVRIRAGLSGKGKC